MKPQARSKAHAAARGMFLALLALLVSPVPGVRAVVPPPDRPSPAGTPQGRPALLAQYFGPGVPGAGFPGGGPGLPVGAGGSRFAQFQGGVFPGGSLLGLAPGQEIRVAAFCTDLLSDPPTAAARFVGGGEARVALADGSSLSLAEALRSGALALRGRDDSFDPVRRDGSLALDLYLSNRLPIPVRLAIPAGTAVTPEGQAAQPLPKEAERLFELAARRRLTYTNTMQLAIWAARGSTAEEVEQANLVLLRDEERRRVQELLDACGLSLRFDRDRGAYRARYREAAQRMGETAEPVRGSAPIALGHSAALEGVRGADGSGYVTIRPRRGGEFYCRATFSDLPDGRMRVRLFHLVTGRPIRVLRDGLVMYPAGPAQHRAGA